MEEMRLTGEAFEKAILQRLSETAEEGEAVSIQTQNKNNGCKRKAIVIWSAESRISPVIYLESLYEKYLEGMSLDELAEGIWIFYRTEMDKGAIDVSDFLDWNKVKSRLFLRVVSTDMNRELLETTVHMEILDLSVVVYVKMDAPGGNGLASVTVSKEHLAFWGQDEEMVYAVARRNTVQEKITFECITSVISRLLSEKERDLFLRQEEMILDCPLYVLTNARCLLGAVYMVIPEIMDQIAAKIGEDIYILPSSIHESLVLAVSEAGDLSQLQQMVLGINEEKVLSEERLSHHVYLYSRKTGLEIAV